MVSLEEKIGHLKKLYRDIVLGFSAYRYAGRPIFIKHLSEIDNAEFEFDRSNLTREAREKGMPSREEKKILLIQEGIWSEEKEIYIETLKKEISDLELSGKNYIIKRQILQNKEKIRKAKTKLNEALKEKDEFFGFCLEDFVEKKMNERFIFNSFFKDKHLKEKAFTEDEFDTLPEIEIGRLVAVLNEFFIDFGHNQIKRISATPFYMSIFSLSDDNPFYFFGKPVSQLTILQINLFSQGRYFKSLVQAHNEKISPPVDVTEDPDKMIEWYESASSSPTTKADGVSYIGATKEELEKMAGGKAITVNDFAAKKGNFMTTKDFVEMHGL